MGGGGGGGLIETEGLRKCEKMMLSVFYKELGYKVETLNIIQFPPSSPQSLQWLSG